MEDFKADDMKILLVNPPYHGWFTLFGLKIPPLGLAYLASALRQAGREVGILDLNVQKPDEAGDFSDYDVVGIGSDTTRFTRAREIARKAKQAGAVVVMGGPHPTTADSEVLREKAVDYVVRSEAEATIVELLDCLEAGRDPLTVRGISLRRNGTTLRSKDRGFTSDVDSILPPARDLLPMDRYRTAKMGTRPVTPLVTSRGCPFRCSFCASSFMNGPKWRAHSAGRVVDEMEEIQRRWGYSAFAFSDDNSLMSPSRTSEIADEIIRRGLDVWIWAFCRADMAARHPEVIEKIAAAGLKTAFVGIESPTSQGLDSVNKGIKLADVPKAIEIFRRNGVEILGSYIIGLENDTLASIRETARWAMRLDTNTAQFSILTPYPGTEIYRRLERRIVRKDWNKYDGYHLVFRHPNLSRFQLEAGLAFCHTVFYLRSIKQIFGFFKFLWQRKEGLGSVRKAADDVIFTP
jgi:anaerobic magnesium-protoporphyrin IX monomethyl ester cyclase